MLEVGSQVNHRGLGLYTDRFVQLCIDGFPILANSHIGKTYVLNILFVQLDMDILDIYIIIKNYLYNPFSAMSDFRNSLL